MNNFVNFFADKNSVLFRFVQWSLLLLAVLMLPFSALRPLICYRNFAYWCLLRSHEFSSSFVFARLPRSFISFLPNEEGRAAAPAALARKASKMEFFHAIKLMKLSFISSRVFEALPDGLPISNWTFNMNETSLAHFPVRWCLTYIFISSVFRYLS